MKKPLLYLWLFGLLILSVPLSYIINVKTNTFYSERQFPILVGVCAAIVFLMFGGISWAAYRYMKKRSNPKPAKNAMLLFTGLTISVMGVSTVGFEKKMKQRNAYLQKDEMRDGFMKSCTEEGNQKLGAQLKAEGIDSVETKIANYCSCVYDKMEMDAEVSDMMFDTSIPPNEIWSHPKVVAMATECAMELFK